MSSFPSASSASGILSKPSRNTTISSNP
jgi:hypothetical protein